MQSAIQASIDFSLNWQSPYGSHEDRNFFPKVDFWRDVFPGDLGERLCETLPGAPFVATFSERWFPPKVIQQWTHLHPFERLALVMDYFRLCEGFEKLQTYSLRGYLRPADDAYAKTHPFADPVFVLWGSRLPH